MAEGTTIQLRLGGKNPETVDTIAKALELAEQSGTMWEVSFTVGTEHISIRRSITSIDVSAVPLEDPDWA